MVSNSGSSVQFIRHIAKGDLPTIHKVHTLASSNSSNNGVQTSQTVDKNH